MARYALVRTADAVVTNVTEWDGDPATWTPPTGHTVKDDPTGTAQIGGKWTSGTTFTPPPAPTPPDPQIATDVSTCKTFLGAASGTATATQRDEAIKATIRLLRRVAAELQ